MVSIQKYIAGFELIKRVFGHEKGGVAVWIACCGVDVGIWGLGGSWSRDKNGARGEVTMRGQESQQSRGKKKGPDDTVIILMDSILSSE
jgi:hypothetical protein